MTFSNPLRVLHIARLIYSEAIWREYNNGAIVSTDNVWFDPVHNEDDFKIIVSWYLNNRKNYDIDEKDFTIVYNFIDQYNKSDFEYIENILNNDDFYEGD